MILASIKNNQWQLSSKFSYCWLSAVCFHFRNSSGTFATIPYDVFITITKFVLLFSVLQKCGFSQQLDDKAVHGIHTTVFKILGIYMQLRTGNRLRLLYSSCFLLIPFCPSLTIARMQLVYTRIGCCTLPKSNSQFVTLLIHYNREFFVSQRYTGAAVGK